jgi:ATP-binding cassette subfamily B protein
MVIDGLIVLGTLLALLFLATPMVFIALGLLPLYAAYLLRSLGLLRDTQAEVLAAYSTVEATFIDHMRGIGEILALGASSPFAIRNEAEHRTFQLRAERLGGLHAGIAFASDLTGGAIVVVALVWGALYVVSGELRLGEFVAGYGLLGGMIPSIQRLTRLPATFQEGSLSASRFRDLLLVPRPHDCGRRTFRLQQSIRLEDAHLVWGSGEPVLDGLNLSLERGESTAIVGANGVGKTTLVSVFNRMRPLTHGRLLVDEIPAETISLSSFRRGVSIVPDEVTLFRGSFAENVLLGRELGDTAKVLARLEELGFRGYLDRFPERWRTRVGEGSRRLSAGERQVVGFLRALASSPALLLVDEGLRSTDAETEEILLTILLRYREEHAVLVVSHEPRVVARMDRVCVLDAGRIVAEGPAGQMSDEPRAHVEGLGTPIPRLDVRASISESVRAHGSL